MPNERYNDRGLRTGLGKILSIWPFENSTTAQWSEGVTKPIKKYSQIDTVWEFLITFGC